VIAVTFLADSNAYAALTALKELESQNRLNVDAAAVVVRGDDGELVVKDRRVQRVRRSGERRAARPAHRHHRWPARGPHRRNLGSLLDLDEVDESESVLSAISASARRGHTSLLAQVTEQSREVVDNAMADLGGTVVLRPVADMEAEIAAAEKAQREAKPGA